MKNHDIIVVDAPKGFNPIEHYYQNTRAYYYAGEYKGKPVYVFRFRKYRSQINVQHKAN